MEPKTYNQEFNTEEFVDYLLAEGPQHPCDETVESFSNNAALPPFYDDTLYKSGQRFFKKHIFALLLGKFLGLLTVLAVPSIVRILIYTKMSGAPLTAYKRYMSTLFHMIVWYQSDFTPGSKLWRSVVEVRNKHNSVSRRACTAGLGRINQRDMALTQFGFVGYALAKREKIGLHNVADEELKGLVHIWRVIGCIMGLEDRFNICRDSVEESSEICKILADKFFKPAVERKHKDFLEMASYLSEGMWAMNPTFNTNVYLNLLYHILHTPNNNNNNTSASNEEYLIDLTYRQQLVLKALVYVVWSLKFTIFRLYHNYTQFLSLWLMKVFPFLAYCSFGYSNSHVRILQSDSKTN